MGGNVTAIIKKTSEKTEAQKIDLRAIKRQNFINKVIELFKFINVDFKKEFLKSIWGDDTILEDGTAFNGSTSYIMNQEFSDAEILKYKSHAGDIDIVVPDYLGKELWVYLDSIEGKEILQGVTYKGCNKPSITSIGSQINSVFEIDFGSVIIPIQVDFELVPFENNRPTEWASFSHSSSFDDAKYQIKAVNHKFLIRALFGASSVRNNILVATPKSTSENYTITKSKIHVNPRMLKFSVDKGVRHAYEELKTPNGLTVFQDGKPVFRALETSESIFETSVQEIYKLAFGVKNCSENDLKDFHSFIGIIEQMKLHLTPEQIQETSKRYIDLLWGYEAPRAQELERNDPETDLEIKLIAWLYFVKELNIQDLSPDYIDRYYSNYGLREGISLRDFINKN